jgi:hypothetical protein
MIKQIKPGRLYFVINIDESYAAKIFDVLKAEQTKLNDWPEGDITFIQWVGQTFGEDGIKYIESKSMEKSDI